MHLFAPLIARAHARPEAVFCWLGEGADAPAVTLGTLAAEAGAVAAALRDAGVRPGQIVPIVLEFGPALFSSFIGCTLADAAPAFLPPLTRKQDPAVFRASMAALLRRIDPGCVIAGAATLPTLDLAGRAVVDPGALAPLAALPPVPQAEPDALAFLQHSSGTTGLKKGVCLSHRAVLRQVEVYAEAIAATPADIVASWLPLYHDMGLITSFLMPAVLGMPIVCIDPLAWVMRPASLLDAIETRGATLCWQPNFAFHHIVRLAEPGRHWNLSSLRLLISCSEPCRTAAFEAFAGRFAGSALRPGALAASYAMAENVFAVTQTSRAGPVRQGRGAASGFLSSGVPVRGTVLRITDAAGAELPPGELGEIRIAGDCLFQGYHHQPDITAERLQGGWYRTGDIGLFDQGELYVVGRLDDVLNINGRKLVAHEIEDALNAVDGIAAGRVLVFADYEADTGATELAVAAERLPGHGAAEPDLAASIRRTVHAVCGLRPKRVRFVPRGFLLKSTSGKISRAASLSKLRDAPPPEGAADD